MTFAPKTISDLAALWVAAGGVNLGIVGNARHVQGYHLGRDRIYQIPPGKGDADNSLRDPRDRAGLTNAASAIDLGAGSQNLGRLFVWLSAECLAKAPDCADIREVIGSPDGIHVFGASYRNGFSALIPDYGDSSHTSHMHISFGRDAELRSKTAWLERYLAAQGDTMVTYGYTTLLNPDGTPQLGGSLRNTSGFDVWDGATGASKGTVPVAHGDKLTVAHVQRSDGNVGSLTLTFDFVLDSQAPWQAPTPPPAQPVIDEAAIRRAAAQAQWDVDARALLGSRP